MPSLRISVEGQVFEATMPQRAVRIGSGPNADVCIALKGVAPEHCVVEPLPNGALKVKDSNSGRGTKVNGNTVRQVSVNPGDEIQLGNARIRYISDSERVVAPAPEPIVAPPAAPTRIVERRSGGDRRRPQNAHVKPAVERRRAPRRVADRPQSKVALAADDSEHTLSTRSRRASKTSMTPWILGGAAVVVVGLVLAMTSGSGGKDASADQARLRSAKSLIASHEYDQARTELEALRSSPSSEVAREARNQLRVIGRMERTLQADLDERWLGHLDLTGDMLGRLVNDMRTRHGTYGETRARAFVTKVKAAQQAWLDKRLVDLEAEAKRAAPRYDFASLMAGWDRFERSAPAGIDAAEAANAGRASVAAAATAAVAQLKKRTEEFTKLGHKARAITVLENALPGFEGLDAAAEVKALLGSARQVEVAEPTPTQEPDTSKPETPTPTDTEKPDPVVAAQAAAVKAIGELVNARQFAKAAELGREHNFAGRAAVDVYRAAAAFSDLVAHINAVPKSYRGLLYAKGLRLDVVQADDDGFSGRVKGGSSSYRWGVVRKAFFAKLVRRWKPEADGAFGAATLLHLIGDDKAADDWLVKAGESGASTATMFDAIAHWRNEPIPEGGYVVHAGRYVTPDERDRLIREARIAEALALLESKDAAKRQGAYATLFEIGKPAAERFQAALTSRRARLIDEIAGSKSFTSSKYKKKLYAELKQRRAHALALIRDAKAYPYPNPNKQNQKEVEARVDKVRQIWERPFELVVAWDKTLKERLTEVTELDENLSKLDGDYAADLQVLADKISQAIAMPAFTPDGGSTSAREYSLKVLGFNERLPTTATKEEKNNVRSVNNYRMMMGMRAVKINERLTRAARGHSRHMKANAYFAHNVPSGKGANATNRTPGNRAKTQGYGGGVGENIAMGPWTGHGAFLAWFGSSGHHRNMLGRWTEMGAGRSDGSYWTQLFGAASGRSLKIPAELPEPPPAFAAEPEDDTGRPVGPPGARVPDEAPPNEGELDEDDKDADDDPGAGGGG